MKDAAGPALLEPQVDRRPPGAPPRAVPARPRRGRRRVLVAGAVVFTVAAAVAAVDALGQVNADAAPLAARFFTAALDPRLDAAFLEVIGAAALTTAAYAVLGTALALIVGFTVGPLLAQAGWEAGGRRPPRGVRFGWVLARGGLAIPRGVHEAVWALLLLAVLGLNPLVAVLAIGLPYGAVTAKVVADLLDEAPRQPMDALVTAGARRPVALLLGLVPAALGDLVAYGFYRLECSLRAAAVLGIVGVGGLGFELALSFQALRYDEMWTAIFALVVLAAAVEAWSATIRRRLGGRRRSGRAAAVPTAGWGRTERLAAVPAPARRELQGGGRAAARRRRDPVLSGSLGGAVVLVAVSAWWLGLDPSTLWADRTLRLAADAVASAWPPDFGAVGAATLFGQAATTLAMAALGAGLAFVLALALVVPAAAASHLAAGRGRIVAAWVLRAPLLVLRAIPPPVWAFVLLLVLLPGILPGALALAVYNLGVLGRLLAEVVEEVDQRPLRALEGLGAGWPTIVACALLPATLTRFAAHGLERWEMAMRDTVIVGLVGAGGLGLVLEGQLQFFAFEAVSATLLVLLGLTFLVDLAGARLRRALR